MYHSISNSENAMAVPPTQFAAQMDYLARNNFRVIPLREACHLLQTKSDLRRTIVLTFDDGYRDFLANAMPVLQQHHFTATLFVVTGRAGQASTWSRYDKTQPLLSVDELQRIKTMGFSLGSHTVAHVDLTTSDDDTLMRELNDSRATLTNWGENFLAFAYPGGQFTRRERDAVRRAGFLLKREPVLDSDSLDWFKRRVNGYYEIDYLLARARGIQTR
jgi:peptidoglycan/xylan/chitin deacetylase (PgdA/CDA1 family)